MASNKQLNQSHSIGQINPINQLSVVNQLNPLINQSINSTISSTINQLNAPTLNSELNSSVLYSQVNQFGLDDKAKKRGGKGRKDAMNKSTFNYQNLNVNLNPKELTTFVQDQSKLIHRKNDSNDRLQFKIVPPNEDGSSSLKLKIATTRKPSGSNSELRKLRIPNQNLTNVQPIKSDSSENHSKPINIQTNAQPIIQSNTIHLNTPTTHSTPINCDSPVINQRQLELINNNKNQQLTSQLMVNSLPSNLNKSLHFTNQSSVISQVSPVEAASGVIFSNNLIPNIKSPDDHEENCMCWLHAGKGKKHPNLPNNSNKDVKSTQQPAQHPKQKYLNSKQKSLSSSSSNSSSSRSSSSSSNSTSRSTSSSSSSGSDSSSTSSSSSSNSSSNSSDCSESSCSSSSNSRSVSRSSCETCLNRRSTSNSSSTSSSDDEAAVVKRGRTRQKELHKSPQQKQIAEQSTQSINSKTSSLKTDQLLKNVKQKLNLNQLNSTIASPFSPSDLPSPSSNLNSNQINNLNSISQPSSVSCESNCYSPAVSINSPSCPVGSTKRTSVEERQRLRSYRLPNLAIGKDRRENKEGKDVNASLDNVSQNASTSEQTTKDHSQTSKKIKKQKLKGEKKKGKLKKMNLKKNDLKEGEIKQGDQVKKKGKKLKLQTDSEGNLVKEKKIKKKGKKKGKLNKNKKLISDAKLIGNIDLVKLLNPSNLSSSNSNLELSKMALLMNANLNMGIPPNIDKNYILPGLSSLIKEDSSILTKQNQYLFNKNRILNSNIANLTSPESASKNTSNSKESQPTNAKQSDKSPDSGIQSQSESPNQSNANMMNESKKKLKRVGKQPSQANLPLSTTKQSTITNASTSTDANNLPKKDSLLVNQIDNISNNMQKGTNFNQFIDSSLQSLLENLQKTSASLATNTHLNQPTTSTAAQQQQHQQQHQQLLNERNFGMIKPKSIPSDFITLTEILLNMNKNKDQSSTLLAPFASKNLTPLQQTSSTSLPALHSTSTLVDKQKKFAKKSFKQISVISPHPTATTNQLNIKNTDLWRNNIELASSPLMLDELSKRLRTSTVKLDEKSSKQGDKRSTKGKSKSTSKKSKKEFLSNVSTNELNKSLALNQHMKKTLLSDIFCANEQDESNQQMSSRSVSSLSQNHYSTDKSGKKKRKKHKSKKLKQDGRIGELSDDLNKLYLNLTDDLSRLRIQVLKDSTSNRSAGAFKCVKYSSGKGKKGKSKSTIQFASSSPILTSNKSNEPSTDKTSKKRKKNASISIELQQQDAKQDQLIESSNSSNNENANEHSLPLKKRHHRHTENDDRSSLDLIDSSNSSSTTDLSNLSNSIKVNSRKATKSTRNNKPSSKSMNLDESSAIQNAIITQDTQVIDTRQTNTGVTNTTKSTLEISQTNSCLVTWVNGKQANNEHSTSECSGKQNLTTFFKAKSNVDNKSTDQYVSDLDPFFNESNMVVTRNANVSNRKLRSNQVKSTHSSSTKQIMGAVKSKFVNSDNNDPSADSIGCETASDQSTVKRLRNNKSIANENNNLNLTTTHKKATNVNMKPSSSKIVEKSKESDLLVNILKHETGSGVVKKKRKKQNKTGFDKPKKRKKPKSVPLTPMNEYVNSDLLKEHDKQSNVTSGVSIGLPVFDDDSTIIDKDDLIKNDNESTDKTVNKTVQSEKRDLDSTMSKIKSKKLKAKSVVKATKFKSITSDLKSSATKLENESLTAVKSKDVKPTEIKPADQTHDIKQIKSTFKRPKKSKIVKSTVKLNKLTSKLKSRSLKSAKKQLNKNKDNLVKSKLTQIAKHSSLKVSNDKKSLKRKLSECDDQQVVKETPAKQVKSIKDVNKSASKQKSLMHIDEAINKADDDFEEVVLKIHSVYSTTLVKKPKTNKIKLKGPTKCVKYYKAGLFSDTFKIDPPSEPNTSASNTPVHQCETPLMDESIAQSDNDDLAVNDDTQDAATAFISNSPDSNSVDEQELKEGKLRFEDKDAQYNGKEPLPTDNDEFSTLLPPPSYVYNKERRKLNDFLLPYDIWWQHVNNQLSLPVNPAKNYKKVKGNVFFDVKPTSNFEEQSCVCVKPANPDELGCGNYCLNRVMWVECNPSLCPCGEQCSNQKLLKNEWAPGLERFLTRDRGWGVRTTEEIKKSSFIIEYIGEIVSEKVFLQRMTDTYSGDSHHYCLNISRGVVIDGYRCANEGRFVNHSCEPNCEMQKWSVNGYYRVGLFALRDILPGEEVTYDYNFYNFNLEQQQTCHCGSSKCRGVIGGKTQQKRLENAANKQNDLNNGSTDKLIIVKSIMKKSNNKRKRDGCLSKVENTGTFDNSISTLDKKKLFEPIKSYSYSTTKYIRKHNIFLIRNFEKFRQLHNQNVEKKRRTKLNGKSDEIYYSTSTGNKQSKDVFNPLYLQTDSNSRSVRTRGYAKVQDNEELIKIYKICNLFKEICQCFTDKVKELVLDDKQLEDAFNYIKDLPRKKKNQESNQENAIGLLTIERNILSGNYKTEESFKNELMKLFKNASKHFEQDAQLVGKIEHLEGQFLTIFNDKMTEFNDLISEEMVDDEKVEKKEKMEDSFEMNKINHNVNLSSSLRISLAALTQTTKETFKILHDQQQLNRLNLDHKLYKPEQRSVSTYGQTTPDCESQELQPLFIDEELPRFKVTTPIKDEEIIRCICTLNKDDGTMIQCDKCNCWQHAHCMNANVEADSYLCERCSPREYDREIKLEKPPTDGFENWIYYFTFTIGENVIKIGDTVYLERDKSKNVEHHKSSKFNSVTFTDFDGNRRSKADVDIFRIEHLYKTADGKKYVFGHHCLRPSETFHEPTRKFYSNEVLSSPLAGSAPLEAVKGHCHVLDLMTFCKGRPIGARENDVYICELKVDKKARSFSKISKSYLSINTRPYCFNQFEEKLRPKRTFSPHNISIAKKESKTSVKQQEKQDKHLERIEPPKVEHVDLTETDIANINKLHLSKFVQKRFNINKMIEKINKLNDEETNQDVDEEMDSVG